MNVVYCVTANYIEKIKPSIRSLRYYNPKANIYVITETDNIGIENAKAINISNQQWFPENSVNYKNMFTYIGLLKVCYESLLSCDKVIHLDADTIVNDTLKPMWEMDLTDKWYAMAEEKKGRYKPFGDKYYNAGVMILNLKQLRKDNIQDSLINYLNTVRQPWCEQDAFNKFGIENDKIVELDVRYNENMMTGFTDNPAIVHYCAVGDWWNNRRINRVEFLDRFRDPL